MDFIKMEQYLKETLEKNDAILDKRHNLTFRNRYEHSLRVFKWVKRLSVDFDNFDYDVALTAALFHDIGYAAGQCDHNIGSSKIFLEYANENNFDKGFTEKVNYIILNHSEKKMLKTYMRLLIFAKSVQLAENAKMKPNRLLMMNRG